MSDMESLRTLRPALVTTAERIMHEAFERRTVGGLKKSQLNHLIGVCGEATCREEIENYLRYQASRERAPWRPEMAQAVIAGLDGVLKTSAPTLGQQERVSAWRLYAVFLTRAFTYENEVHNGSGKSRGGPGQPRQHGGTPHRPGARP